LVLQFDPPSQFPLDVETQSIDVGVVEDSITGAKKIGVGKFVVVVVVVVVAAASATATVGMTEGAAVATLVASSVLSCPTDSELWSTVSEVELPEALADWIDCGWALA
jgi:hypothetical protein